MTYSDSIVSSGRLFPRASSTAGEAPALRPGEVAANAADGCLYVGMTGGNARSIPGAAGITQIVSLTQAEYDALTPVASTLYIITPTT